MLEYQADDDTVRLQLGVCRANRSMSGCQRRISSIDRRTTKRASQSEQHAERTEAGRGSVTFEQVAHEVRNVNGVGAVRRVLLRLALLQLRTGPEFKQESAIDERVVTKSMSPTLSCGG